MDEDLRAVPLRVAVVDDDEAILRVLSILLGQHEDIEVVGQATTGPEALTLVAEERPDAVLLDLMLGAERGTDLVSPMLELHPGLMIAGLTSLSAEREEAGVLAAGAFTFYEKPMINELPGYLVEDRALHLRALAGERVTAPSATSRRVGAR